MPTSRRVSLLPTLTACFLENTEHVSVLPTFNAWMCCSRHSMRVCAANPQRVRWIAAGGRAADVRALALPGLGQQRLPPQHHRPEHPHWSVPLAAVERIWLEKIVKAKFCCVFVSSEVSIFTHSYTEVSIRLRSCTCSLYIYTLNHCHHTT